MPKTLVQIGPAENGRRMSLADFDHAEVREGYRYELGRGVIQVSDIPGKRHLAQFNVVRRQLGAYDASRPGRIHTVAGGAECKLMIAAFDSERHPDLAVYLAPPPDEEDFWSTWIPAIVVEIVSPGSEQRDYGEKRDEYLAFGVSEYWIIDADKGQMLVLRRHGGRWKEHIVRPPEKYRTHLLPGFEFDVAAVLQAAEASV